jgi:hypothetical protein
MKLIIFLLALCPVIFFSCSNSTSTPEIDNICNCLKKSEYYEIINDIDFKKLTDEGRAEDYSRKITNKFLKVDYDSKENVILIKCFAKNLKSILSKYKDLKDDKQKGKLLRNALTTLINNECAAPIIEKLPFSEFEDQFEKNEMKLDIKQLIKFLEKIEKAKDFEEIQREVLILVAVFNIKSEVCECADTMLSMMKEAKDAKGDRAIMDEIQEKYKTKMDKCQKLDEGKSDEEKKKMEEEMKACPAYQEVEKIMKESFGGN